MNNIINTGLTHMYKALQHAQCEKLMLFFDTLILIFLIVKSRYFYIAGIYNLHTVTEQIENNILKIYNRNTSNKIEQISLFPSTSSPVQFPHGLMRSVTQSTMN